MPSATRHVVLGTRFALTHERTLSLSLFLSLALARSPSRSLSPTVSLSSLSLPLLSLSLSLTLSIYLLSQPLGEIPWVLAEAVLDRTVLSG